MKKLLKSFLVCTLLVLGLNTSIVHASNNSNTITYTLTQDEYVNEYNRQIEELMSIQNSYRTPSYVDYKYVKDKTIEKTASGYAGNQPAGGVKFETGGGFYWSPSGGPTKSVSLGASYAGISVSLGLGVKTNSTTGYYCAAPNKTNYFKLYVTTYYNVTPTKVYGKQSAGSSWEYLYTLYPKVLNRASLSAKKQ